MCVLRANVGLIDFVSGVLYVVVLLPLALRIGGGWPRRLALVFITLYLTSAVTDLIEAYFFTTLLTPFTLLAALAVEAVPMLVIAVNVVGLVPASCASGTAHPIRLSDTNVAWRVLLTGALYMPMSNPGWTCLRRAGTRAKNRRLGLVLMFLRYAASKAALMRLIDGASPSRVRCAACCNPNCASHGLVPTCTPTTPPLRQFVLCQTRRRHGRRWCRSFLQLTWLLNDDSLDAPSTASQDFIHSGAGVGGQVKAI